MDNKGIVLAAGSGSRMKSSVKKQYLHLGEKPLLYYSLKAMEDSQYIGEVVLVVGANEQEYAALEIVDRYNLKKVKEIVQGGSQRYNSVINGLKAVDAVDGEIIFVQDGARPFLTETILERLYEAALEEGAAIAAVKSKDTVKLGTCDDFVAATPNRDEVWIVQTPQAFRYDLIKEAYGLLEKEEDTAGITDDACVVERYTGHRIRLVEGSYENIKITTPEDMAIAEYILEKGGYE